VLKRSNKKETDAIVEKTAEVLGDLHRRSFYHGASQIRNFTMDDRGNIHIIDFEESFSKSVDMKALQLRDLFLLIYSLHRQKM